MGRIKALDGLRGLAVSIVVFSHLVPQSENSSRPLDFGWVGVEIFFVLSGFLIGSIILDEAEQPGFVFRFYTRRAARILPAYWMMLLFSFLVVSPIAQGKQSYPLFTYLTFSQNIVNALGSQRDALWTAPLWTLGVEEQFYLVLPLIMLLTPRRWTLPVLVSIWLSSQVFRLCAFFAHVDPSDTLFLLPARADLLVAGVIAAWVNHRGLPARYLPAIRLAPALCLFAGSALVVLGKVVFADFSQTFYSIALGAFILALVNGAPEARGVMESPLLGRIGQISYCLYLIHLPIYCALRYGLFGSIPHLGLSLQSVLALSTVSLSVAAAMASWRWLEKPIIDYARGRLRISAPALAA